MEEKNHHLARIFSDASSHKEVARIVARHLTSKADIRNVALEGIDLTGLEKVLDLGCGFGFFTAGLEGKNHQIKLITGIDCHPEYEWFYFHSCEKVDTHVKKRFIGKGSEALKDMEADSYDLVLCSYALYFFPEMIPEVARILKKEGLFIVITHATPHLHQFSEFVRDLLREKGAIPEEENPYERLIGKFSDKNGLDLLGGHFHHVCTRHYRSEMVFKKGDHEDFATYFNFKRHFFIPPAADPENRYHDMVLEALKEFLEGENVMEITKDDIIYICSEPVQAGAL